MQGQNTALAIQLATSALVGNGTPQDPGLIQLAENAMGPGNGTAKHDLVIGGINAILYGTAVEAAQNHPNVAAAYAPVASPLLAFFSKLISTIVSGRKAAGVPVVPAVPPTADAPPPNDVTAPASSTLSPNASEAV